MEKFLKKMWLLPVCICTMLSCLALTACSDDDDDNSNDEPETTVDSSTSQIIGSWSGDVDGDTFVLTFSTNGKMNEKVDGKDYGSVGYTYSDGVLTFSGDAVIENSLGSAPYLVTFPSSSKMKLTKKNDTSSYATFTKL